MRTVGSTKPNERKLSRLFKRIPLPDVDLEKRVQEDLEIVVLVLEDLVAEDLAEEGRGAEGRALIKLAAPRAALDLGVLVLRQDSDHQEAARRAWQPIARRRAEGRESPNRR